MTLVRIQSIPLIFWKNKEKKINKKEEEEEEEEVKF